MTDYQQGQQDCRDTLERWKQEGGQTYQEMLHGEGTRETMEDMQHQLTNPRYDQRSKDYARGYLNILQTALRQQ